MFGERQLHGSHVGAAQIALLGRIRPQQLLLQFWPHGLPIFPNGHLKQYEVCFNNTLWNYICFCMRIP
jgi:hypothetical protein